MGGYKLPKAEQNELTELEALAALASVIESGKGEAVVPDGVLLAGYNAPNTARPNGLDLTKVWTCKPAGHGLADWTISCHGDLFFTYTDTLIEAINKAGNALRKVPHV